MYSRLAITRHLTLAAQVWLARRGGALYTEACIWPADCNPNPESGDKSVAATGRGLRLDVVHCGPQRAPGSTGIEVKSCRGDWLADDKCHLYLGRVSELYLATLPGVLTPDELPDGCGLLELNCAWRAVPQPPPPSLSGEGITIEYLQRCDVFKVVKPAAVCAVPVEHELDLLRGLVQSSRRVDSSWQAQRRQELELATLLRAIDQPRRVA